MTRIEVTENGERVFMWRSGVELVVCGIILMTAANGVVDALRLLMGREGRQPSVTGLVIDAIFIGLMMAGYALLRRRNARRERAL